MSTENSRFGKISRNQAFKFRDVVIDSAELRKLIKHQMKHLNLKTWDVTEANNISYGTFKKYMRDDKTLSSASLRQEHLMNVAESLGIRIRIQLIVKKVEDIDRSFFERKEEL